MVKSTGPIPAACPQPATRPWRRTAMLRPVSASFLVSPLLVPASRAREAALRVALPLSIGAGGYPRRAATNSPQDSLAPPRTHDILVISRDPSVEELLRLALQDDAYS